jgi:hypothetical protein
MRAVADTSTLVDLAIPYVSSDIDTTGHDDPLKVFMTVYDVHIPTKVEEELGELWVGNDDLIAAAAELVLDIHEHLIVDNPHELSSNNSITDVPALEPGELHAIHLANHLSPPPEIFATSEFGKNYDSIMQDQLNAGILCKSTPELLRDLAVSGYFDRRFASTLLNQLAELKGWDREYIGYLRYTLR